MGLYLCVFARPGSDEEVDGVEVGGYDDFHAFRTAVAEHLGAGDTGSRFPVLMDHHDSNGTWSPAEAELLERELLTIADEMVCLPATGFGAEWQRTLATSLGLNPNSMLDSFIDVDGEPLVERLIGLARTAQQTGQDIWFQ